MPLFSSKPAPTPTAPVQEEKRGLFGRKQSVKAPATTTTTTHHTHTNNAVKETSHSGTGTGLLHRNHEDASIVAARERVIRAEQAERDADQALIRARHAVREAREHIKHLEREAKEEARLARIKQEQASKMSKRGMGLGRHEHH